MPRCLAALALWALAAMPLGVRGEEGALRFGGAQRLTLPPADLSGPHTVEMWLRARGPLPPAAAPARLLSLGGTIALDISRAGIDHWIDLGGRAPLRTTVAGIEAGRWHHISAGFDGRRVRVHLDGRVAGVRIAIGEAARRPGAPAEIGAGAAPAAAGFVGEIDEVRFWRKSRLEAEVREDYRKKLEGNEPALAGYLSLDGEKGQMALDRSPAAWHGVLGRTRFPELDDPAWTESSSPVRKPDPEYQLLFDPPGPLATGSGEEFVIRCVLRSPVSAAAPPLRGFSISLQHDRLLLFLLEASARGAAIAPYLKDGFAHFESIDGPGGTGFVGRAILDGEGEALGASGDLVLALATYRSLAPRQGREVVTSVRFEEGLPGATGPARNSMRIADRQVLPVEGYLEVSIRAPEVALGFTQEDGIRASPGGRFELDCLLKVALNAGEGPQAWSISVQHDPARLEVLEVTTSGTVVERAEAETGVFKLTELVDNESGAGFLSAIILALDRPYTLPPNGVTRIARARYQVREGVKGSTTTAIAYIDGLQQSGVAIENLVVFQAGPTQPYRGSVPVDILEPRFVRGDFNLDGRVNLGDAAGLLAWLFRDGFPPGCLDAADATDDGRADIADPILVLRVLFQGAGRFSAPYPAPGLDPTSDALDCERPVGGE